ncbi:unnamed protein product, partial [Cylindrotheca closterium]
MIRLRSGVARRKGEDGGALKVKCEMRQSIFQKDPQHPIFDGLDQIRFRALFALALGCDALPGGIDGFGAKKASIIRSKIDFSADPAVAKEELLKHLVAASLISKPKIYRHVPAGLTREDFICLSDSLIYEPTHSGYLTGHKPAALEKYNIDFAEEGAGVACRSNGAASETCKGCFSYGHHAFLKAEDAHQCNFCKHPVCRSCLWDPSLRNKNTLKKETRTSVPNQSTHKEIAINPDYRAVQVCLDALEDVEALSRLQSKEPPTFTPIGFELLDYRVSNTVPLHERKSPGYKKEVEDAKIRLNLALLHANKKNSRGYWRRSQAEPTKQSPVSTTVICPPTKRLRLTTSGGKEKRKRRCCAKWCNNVAYLPHTVPIVRRPKLEGVIDGEDEDAAKKRAAKNDSKMIRCKQSECIRNEIRERLGHQRVPPRGQENADMRYCDDHQMEWVTNKSTTCRLTDGSTKCIRVKGFMAPIGTGGKGFRTPTKTLSKGVSSDRLLFRQIHETKTCSQFASAMQQRHEVEDVVLGNQSWDDINKRLIAAAGLDVHCGNTGTPK